MRFADRTPFAIRTDTNIAGDVAIVCSVESNISRRRSVMTFSAAVVIPLETGSKLEEWLESRAKEPTQADVRLRFAVAGLAAMRREGRLTRSQKAKPAVLPLDDNEEDLLAQGSYHFQRRGRERLGRRHQGGRCGRERS
jgi:hypothetical protein